MSSNNKKVLIGIVKNSTDPNMVTSCYIIDRPEGAPPFKSPPFNEWQVVEFEKPFLAGPMGSRVIVELSKLGYQVTVEEFSA